MWMQLITIISFQLWAARTMLTQFIFVICMAFVKKYSLQNTGFLEKKYTLFFL